MSPLPTGPPSYPPTRFEWLLHILTLSLCPHAPAKHIPARVQGFKNWGSPDIHILFIYF